MSELPIRQPAVAGQFYPGNPDTLRQSVQKYVNEATLPEDIGVVRAVVAPHAGYIYSGPTAGYAFKALTTLAEKKWTVFLLGPAHRAYFSSVSLGKYSAFRTPLGDVPVAVDRVAEMLARSPLYTSKSRPHAAEHCLEVEIPFLQVTLADFMLAPMLFGAVDPGKVAEEIVNYIDKDDLIVVSSDLSHFHSHDEAQRLDHTLLEAVMAGDEDGVLEGEACGQAPLTTLMEIARRKGWRPHLLDHRTSGDTAGDKGRVVGYASIAYTE